MLWLVVGLALWWATIAWFGPILGWPHDDPDVRRSICLQAGMAMLLVPLVVGLATKPESNALFAATNATTKLRLAFLKVAGAYTGFFAFAGIAVFVSLTAYYLTGRSTTGFETWLLSLCPLLFAYVAARRIPIDRRNQPA